MQNFAAPSFETDAISADVKSFCLLIFPEGVEDEIIEILDQLGVPGFTQSKRVTGRGPRGRHFDNPIWPGTDGAIFTVIDREQASLLANQVVQLSQKLESSSRGLYGVRMFTWNCQQLV